MKRLTLIRHAKSSWKSGCQEDVDRPLNKRGHRDAPRMGLFLKENAPECDRIVTSTALRARSTAALIADAYGIEAQDLVEHPDLYLASADTLIRAIRDFPDDWHHPALVGHNPGITYLAEYLTDRPFGNIPTCGILHLLCPIARWAELKRDACQVVFYQVPRQLPPPEE